MTNINGINNSHMQQPSLVQEQLKEMMTGTDFYGLELDLAELEESLLEDAKEELSFSKDNSKQTKLASRKQRNAEHKLEERLKKLRESVEGRVQTKSQAQDLQNEASRRDCTSEDLLGRLKQYGGHDAESYALLVELAEREQDARKAQLFKQAATELYRSNQASIDAVINALNVEDGPQFGGLDRLDNAENYAEALINFKDSYDMLNFIMKKYAANPEAGFEFMTKALGADLDAAHKSHAPEFLQGVATGLAQAKVLYSGYNHELNLLDRLTKVHELDTSAVNKLEFLNGVGRMSAAAFVSPNDVRNLLLQVNTRDPEQEVVLCQELSKTLHNMADVMFGTPEARSKVNDACMRLIDSAIEKEDEWLAKQ